MGVWLRLFHGRDDPEADLEDWGYDGPLIGPLRYVHTTYANCVKYAFCYEEDARRFGMDPEGFIPMMNECLVFEDQYYGDWSVTSEIDPGAHAHD